MRSDRIINVKHHEILEKACSISMSVDVQPTKSRLCGRQQHRSNAYTEDGSVEGYYCVNLTVPFLDYLLAEFRSRYIKQINLLLI